jgi:hypothetical protein
MRDLRYQRSVVIVVFVKNTVLNTIMISVMSLCYLVCQFYFGVRDMLLGWYEAYVSTYWGAFKA